MARVSPRQISNTLNTVSQYCRWRVIHVLLIAFSTLFKSDQFHFQLLESLNSLALANVCLRIKQSSPDLFNTSGKTQSDK